MQDANYEDKIHAMTVASSRRYTAIDRLIMRLQPFGALPSNSGASAYPGTREPEASMDQLTRQKVADLIRVDHAGEIAAQALYRGQAMVARDETVRIHLLTAAQEENVHLHWCSERLRELDDRPSRLAPFWYAGAFAIGSLAGLAGDRISLGFVEETERQVGRHLRDHIDRLPASDLRSRRVLESMEQDEARHGREAREAGGRPLPKLLQRLMWAVSGVMKFAAARV